MLYIFWLLLEQHLMAASDSPVCLSPNVEHISRMILTEQNTPGKRNCKLGDFSEFLYFIF